MGLIDDILTGVIPFVPVLAALAVTIAGLAFINNFLRRRWRDNPEAQFRFQLIMLVLSLAGGLVFIIALPINDLLRGQLLSLLGILLSAAIALSSTTFIGNILAGIMLKVIESARPGDFISVENITGRITEMSLLHTEVQTEDRDLVTIPNLYMVTKPMKVVRSSGTIISVDISLAYDIPRTTVSTVLSNAAEQTGLSNCYVQIRELGDFAIVYRVAGLLQEVQSMISARSKLRETMLDYLHEANIEIVSPSFMNTRSLTENTVFIPSSSDSRNNDSEVAAPEELAFDKADEAASIETIRNSLNELELALSTLGKSDTESASQLHKKQATLKNKKKHLLKLLKLAEQQLLLSDKVESHHIDS